MLFSFLFANTIWLATAIPKKIKRKIMNIFKDLDDALIGITDDPATGTKRWVYDYNKCVETLILQGESEQSAVDWIEYNVIGSNYGKSSAIIVYKNDKYI